MNKIKIWIIFLMFLFVSCSTSPTIRPIPTTQPTITAIPGWKRFEAEGLEFWLPESYVGGFIGEELNIILEHLRILGPDYEAVAHEIEKNSSAYYFFATDTERGMSATLTIFFIMDQIVFSETTMDMYLDYLVRNFAAQNHVVERDIVSLGDNETGRLVIWIHSPDGDAKDLWYFIKIDDTMWSFTYSTQPPEEFEQRLPIFEQSASTIVIKQQGE